MKGHIATLVLIIMLALVVSACVPYVPPPEDPDPPADPVNDTDPVDDAPVNDTESDLTLEVYCSIPGPFCDRMWTETVPQLDEMIEVEFRHFPLSFHVNAYNASLAVECARAQGTDRAYVDALFADDRDLTLPVLVDIADGLGLESIESCVASETHADVVDADIERGAQKSVRGTPSSFVTDGENNVYVAGAQPLSVFEDAIARAEAGEWDPIPPVIDAPDELNLTAGEWTNLAIEVTGEGDVRRRAHIEELTLRNPIADTPFLFAEPLPVLRPVDFEDEDGNELAFDPAIQFPLVEPVDGGFALNGPVEVRWYIGLDRNITNFDDRIMFGDREIEVIGDRGSHVMLTGAERIQVDRENPEELDGMTIEVLNYEEVRGGPYRAGFAIDGEAFTIEIDDSKTIEVSGQEFTTTFLGWDAQREVATVSIELVAVDGTQTTVEVPIAQSQQITLAGITIELEVIGVTQRIVDQYVIARFGDEEVELREEESFFTANGQAFYLDDIFRVTIPVDIVTISLYHGFDALRVNGSLLERYTNDGAWVATDFAYRDEGQYIAYGTEYSTLAPDDFVVDEVFGLFAFGVETGFGEPELVFEDRSIERDGLSLRPLAPRNATLLIEATDDTGLTSEHRIALIAQ